MLRYFLLPPGGQLVLLLLAVIVGFRYRGLSLALIVLSLASLYLFSVRPVANALMSRLEVFPAYDYSETMSPEQVVIVILGNGLQQDAPEYDHQPQPTPLLTQRLRYGAHLARETGWPILVSGGTVDNMNEAEVMQQVLETDFRIPVRWLESTSLTTAENARNSYQILEPLKKKQVLLVTQAWHMPRASGAFEQVGFTVIPAPTGKTIQPLFHNWRDWVPNVRELKKSQFALHEYAGLIWYRYQGWIE